MKKIPIVLQDAYNKPGRSTCFLVKIVRKDGTVSGFAALDADVTFNDGIHSITYDAFQELRPQNIQTEANYDVDNTDLVGWFNTAMEKLVLAGAFAMAEITIYRVAYLNLSAGPEVIAYGTVGAVDFSTDRKGKRTVAYRSLMQQLKQTVNEPYSLTCRAAFGDERCGMPFVWSPAAVGAVGDNPYMALVLSGVVAADGYYDFGIIEVLTGDNAGAELEIESWLSTGVVQLSFLAPFPFKVGDTLRIRRDCGKTEADCLAYGNIVNMRAEHLTPVQDRSIMVPGAYIKSVGAQ